MATLQRIFRAISVPMRKIDVDVEVGLRTAAVVPASPRFRRKGGVAKVILGGAFTDIHLLIRSFALDVRAGLG